MKKRPARAHPRHLTVWHRVAHRLAQVLWYGVAVIGALVAIVFVAARMLLPTVSDQKQELEALLARESGYQVRIEQLEGYWDGLYPGLRVRGIDISSVGETRPSVRLAEVRFSLQILPLLIGRLNVHSGVLVGPRLTLERLTDGRFRISGFSAIEEADPAQTQMFAEWLFRQNRLTIEDGELLWLDRHEPQRPLRLKHVQLQLRNDGERHRLGMSAEFPPGICDSCYLAADVYGNPFLGTPFDGRIYLRADAVNVEHVPRVVREQLPQTLRGVFSAELWSEWEDSRPVDVQGRVAVAHLQSPVRGLRASLSLKQATTALHWRAQSDGFDVKLTNLQLALHGDLWSVGDAQFSRRDQDLSLKLDRVELADITSFVASLQPASNEIRPYQEAAALWTALQPAGLVKDLRVQLSGALDAPDDFTIAADMEAVELQAYRGWPGVRGVAGVLWMTPEQGTFKLDVHSGALSLPKVFRAPLPIARADAEVRWQRVNDQWVVTSESMNLRNEDIQASGRLLLRLPDDPARSPYLAMNMEFRDGNGAHAARYYPVHQLNPATLAWMEYAFAGGTVTRGTLVYDGHLHDFPFTQGEGKFEIRATARDAVYRYLTGWEPVTNVVAEVTVQGDRFVVTGHGRIGTLKAHEILVTNNEAHTVRVNVNVLGATAESLRVLRGVKSGPGQDDWKVWLAPSLDASGEGLLGLNLMVPLGGEPVRVRGEYRFLGGGLRFTDIALEASQLGGSLRFTEDGVREGRVRARLLGGESVLAITSPGTTETVAVWQGRATAAGLAPFLGPKFSPAVSGEWPWQARLRLVNGRPEISAEADLSAVHTSLPAPLNRLTGLFADKLQVRTESSSRDQLVLNIGAGGSLQGRVRMERRGAWQFGGGRLMFNETPARVTETVALPAERGLQLLMRLGDFDLDRWLAFVGDVGSGQTPGWLARVSANIDRLRYLDRDFGAISLDLVRDRNGWVGGLSGRAAEGRIRFTTVDTRRIGLDLNHLRLPPTIHKEGPADTDPRKLPALTINVKSLYSKDREVGELDFAASPIEQGWKVERLKLVRPETRVETSGDWRMEYGRSVCNFSLRFASQDVGKAMAAFGMPDQISGTEADLNMSLSWVGTPTGLEYHNLNGQLEVSARKGRILKLEQGAGRMFGILDLSAIGRYLTFDFSPIFGKGFAFDRIDGKVTIERGNAYVDGFSIRGPSAKLYFSGRMGLAAEDFNLVLDVYPSLSDSLTLGSLVAGGPQVALWAFLVQKLFKKQIEEGTRVSYIVKGPWSKPDISRKLVEPSVQDPATSTN